MSTFFKALAIIIIALGGLFLLSIVMFPLRTATKVVDVAYDAQDKVLTADNAIYNYEWFKQQYQLIEAASKQYQNAIVSQKRFRESLPASRLDWTFEDKQEDSRLSAISDGLYNYHISLIADYNAKASMATRNIFENSVLPSYVDALTFITK